MCKTNTFYPLHLPSVTCQFHLNKSGGKKNHLNQDPPSAALLLGNTASGRALLPWTGQNRSGALDWATSHPFPTATQSCLPPIRDTPWVQGGGSCALSWAGHARRTQEEAGLPLTLSYLCPLPDEESAPEVTYRTTE